MNIVVTIPMSRMPQIEQEEAEAVKLQARGLVAEFFWALHRKPLHLNIGDRVYFVWDGAVRAWHKVVRFDKDLKCSTTNMQYYRKFCVVMDATIQKIAPVPMVSFRGYKYYHGD